MVLDEQCFPRGGKKPKILHERKKFDFLGNSDKIGKKRRYKTKVIQYDEDKDLDHLSDASSEADGEIKSVSAEVLTYKTIRQGMNIMGRVSNISDTQIKVSLPGRLSVFVMASYISAPYTKLLQSYVNDEIEDIKKLNEIIHVGEYVNVNISSVDYNRDKAVIAASMMPQDINRGIISSNVREGSFLRGAVESIEDHGFVIDLGIPNCRTFLPKKLTNEDFNLEIGQVIWCVVKKCQKTATNSIVTVTNKIEALNSACITGDKIQYYTVNDLKPGMAVDLFVNKPLKDGAEGLILSNCVGYVHFSQIGEKLRTGKSVKAYLLYTMPVTKLPFFTTRDVFSSLTHNIEDEIHHKIGDIIEEAKVTKVTDNAVIFKLDEGFGIMSKRLSSAASDDCNISELYSTGSIHKIRILDYYASDYACVCTDDKAVLESKYFSLTDFHIGEAVEAIIEKVADRGIAVKVDRLRGWIPEIHTTDIGLYHSKQLDHKHSSLMAKKFQIGQKISTRVLKVDATKNLLHLTAKPSLLSPDIKILSKFEDAKVGYQYKGVIVSYLQHGVLVSFFDEVKAIINRNELSNQNVNDIRRAFNIGQIVNCTVLSVDVNSMKMMCSLKRPGKIDDDNSEVPVKSKSKKRRHSENEFNDTSTEVADENSTEKTKKKKKKSKTAVDTEPAIQSPNIESSIDETKSKKKNKKKKAADDVVNNVCEETDESHSPKKKKRTEKNIDIETKKEEINSQKFSSINNFWEMDASTLAKNTQKSDDASSIDSDDEINKEQTKKKKKKLTVSEKVEKARQEEEKLRDIERELIAAESQPKSSDQFDRLLLANPNSSELWIAYMAFHLQATEIDRARAVAKKALNSISFREEHDKLNIWLALLNLENRFGTKESLKVTMQEALQANDSYQIHSKMVDMFVETGKVIELTTLADTLLAKYKSNPEMYTIVGQACYKTNLIEKARAAMQKAVSRLDKKQHVPILIKFAEMERNNGDSERAETIFEQIVGCLPKRVDVWCVYTDMLIKSGMIDNARLVLERAVAQKLQPRKMKILYKKWMELEEKFGKPDDVENIRQMAIKYVENTK